MKKQYRWKFLREVDGKIKSQSGDSVWEIGETKKHEGNLIMCESGFHCCQDIWQAFGYVSGEILAKVEVSGKNIVDKDKEVWEIMKIVKAYKWKKIDSVSLSIYAAELVIENYEKLYPNDDRPRKAIEAAKAYVKSPTEENRSAAESAAESAARSAWSAESAAESAARSAWSAAESAAWSARSAASAAESAAESAARSAAAIIEKISKWMEKRVKSLEEIK